MLQNLHVPVRSIIFPAPSEKLQSYKEVPVQQHPLKITSNISPKCSYPIGFNRLLIVKVRDSIKKSLTVP